MSTPSLKARVVAPVWRHLRQADWPLLPLVLVAVLFGVRVVGAQFYAYWNTWLTCFTGLLGAYALAACTRIVLQSVCFDNGIACWSVLVVVVMYSWVFGNAFTHYIDYMGVPTAVHVLPLLVALAGAVLLVVPAEIAATRARWARRAAEREAERMREETTKRQLLEARLAALQGQIEPHFLYNTLANARALIRQDASAAEQLLQHLNQFLRSAMPDLRAQNTSLGQELERAQAYLDIIKMRMGERLRFDIDASEEALACQIPPLSVMTLIENAIQHGIEPKVEGGSVRVTAVCAAERLRVGVEDDGAGFQAELGDGVGLVNLQERLAALYGDAAELRLEPGADGGLCATIELPMHAGGKS
jgi:signal transduction histidine kinase